MANKVLFGFSDLYVGTYSVDTSGSVTLGTPYHQAGAVGFSPEPNGSKEDFYADNIAYFTDYGDGSREGDLEVAMFDDTFKTMFLGYVTASGGGLAEIKNPTKPKVYMMFEIQGDDKARRVIMYNGSFGQITRNMQTMEGSKTPQTETLPVSFIGDNKTGIVMVTYKSGDTGYNGLFTNPPVPTITT